MKKQSKETENFKKSDKKNYRERLKIQGIEVKLRTRKTCKENRKKWREQKRIQRANMSRQKKTAINAKRREAYKEKKCGTSSVSPSPVSAMASEIQSGEKSSTFRVAKSRQKQKITSCLSSMPDNPILKAAVIEAAINQQSPRTKTSINQRLGVASPNTKAKRKLAMEVSDSFREALNRLKSKRKKRDIREKHLIAKALKTKGKAILTSFGISKKLQKRVNEESGIEGWEDSRKKRKDTLSNEERNRILNVYDIASHNIPDARGAVKVNGQVQARKIMENSLSASYDKYAKDVKNPVSYRTFVRQKPKNVLPFTNHRFRECLCEYCLNIELILKSINSACASANKNCQIADRYAASKITLCQKADGEYKNICLDRNCETCGMQRLSEHLPPILIAPYLQSSITWWQWEKGDNRKLTKVKKESLLEDLVDTLKMKMVIFSKHLFNARWQYQQYKAVSGDPPLGTAVFCMDYAENFTCKAQDAPQGFHWNNTQVTIHSIVASYKCHKCPENPKTVTDSMVFISDDLTHDHHGVQHFVEIGIKRLLEESEGNITHVLQFSDGAPTQYKNKKNFVNCSFSEEDFGVKTEKHFFGSRHGKGPCDREIGVLKKCVKNAVAAGCQDILEPMQFFQYCTENLSLPKGGVDQDHAHTKRQFFYVKKTDVNRNLPERTNVKQLKDTRNYHCIRSVQPYVISVRERSCFCEGCLGEGEPCVNFDITGQWTVVNLKKGVHEEGRRERGRGVQQGQARCGRGRGVQQDEGRHGRGCGVQRGQGRRGRGRGVQRGQGRRGRGCGVQRGQGRCGRGYHRDRHSSSSSSSVAYVTSDDDNDEAAYSDDSTEDGDSFKSDDETSLPTCAVVGNKINVHKDDYVEDSEDDTLKDIPGLTAIIAELETDETVRLSPVYSMEYLAILEQTEDSELEVAVNKELQIVQDIAILEQSQEALVMESGEFQTTLGPAIVEQSKEALVMESGEFQTAQGPAMLEQSQEALVTESGKFQTPQGPAMLEQSQEELVTESGEFQTIQGPAIVEQSQEALVTECGGFQTIQGPAMLEQSQEALVTESGEFQTIQGPAIEEQSQKTLVRESGEFQTIQGQAIVEQSQEAPVTESGEFQTIQGPAIEEQSQEAIVMESGEFQTIQGPAILEKCPEALVTERGEFQTLQGPAIIEGQERYTAGQYVLVAHGQCSLPAVVQEWPFVQFYYPAKNGLWTEGEICHTVLFEDIKKTLLPPDLRLNGSRIYFFFLTCNLDTLEEECLLKCNKLISKLKIICLLLYLVYH